MRLMKSEEESTVEARTRKPRTLLLRELALPAMITAVRIGIGDMKLLSFDLGANPQLQDTQLAIFSSSFFFKSFE